MEKLRKIGERLWYNKERMVLAVMVALLFWNVYKVMYPPTSAQETQHALMKQTVNEEEYLPQAAPAPAPRPPAQWDMVYKPNPFWFLSGGRETEQDKNRPQDVGISLLKIRKVKDAYRAQLKTASRVAWYEEGEAFESFELLKINPDEGTCEVRSEQLGRVITLSLAGE